MIHGPGCPVCVLPIGRIDNAIELAARPGMILCTYADTMRVPASKGLSLLKAKARGADIRMVYSSADALRIAQENPDREVVFFAIGFETTTPPTAVAIREAAALGLANFSVFCNHVLTPAAIANILESPEVRELGTVPLDGFIGPAHVSTVIGSQPYEYFAEEYAQAGGDRRLRAARRHAGDPDARAPAERGPRRSRERVHARRHARRQRQGARRWWRRCSSCAARSNGAGWARCRTARCGSGRSTRAFDAEARYGIAYRSVADNKACECGAILRGVKQPTDCRLFGTVCTPENPIGSCMVSSEGACAAHYTYGRFKDAPIVGERPQALERRA